MPPLAWMSSALVWTVPPGAVMFPPVLRMWVQPAGLLIVSCRTIFLVVPVGGNFWMSMKLGVTLRCRSNCSV